MIFPQFQPFSDAALVSDTALQNLKLKKQESTLTKVQRYEQIADKLISSGELQGFSNLHFFYKNQIFRGRTRKTQKWIQNDQKSTKISLDAAESKRPSSFVEQHDFEWKRCGRRHSNYGISFAGNSEDAEKGDWWVSWGKNLVGLGAKVWFLKVRKSDFCGWKVWFSKEYRMVFRIWRKFV
jgi:hypothetical protein